MKGDIIKFLVDFTLPCALKPLIEATCIELGAVAALEIGVSSSLSLRTYVDIILARNLLKPRNIQVSPIWNRDGLPNDARVTLEARVSKSSGVEASSTG